MQKSLQKFCQLSTKPRVQLSQFHAPYSNEHYSRVTLAGIEASTLRELKHGSDIWLRCNKFIHSVTITRAQIKFI